MRDKFTRLYKSLFSDKISGTVTKMSTKVYLRPVVLGEHAVDTVKYLVINGKVRTPTGEIVNVRGEIPEYKLKYYGQRPTSIAQFQNIEWGLLGSDIIGYGWRKGSEFLLDKVDLILDLRKPSDYEMREWWNKMFYMGGGV